MKEEGVSADEEGYLAIGCDRSVLVTIFGVDVGDEKSDNAPVTCEEQWRCIDTKPHRSLSEK